MSVTCDCAEILDQEPLGLLGASGLNQAGEGFVALFQDLIKLQVILGAFSAPHMLYSKLKFV